MDSGGKSWDLLVDRDESNAGYTLEDYLAYKSPTPCTFAGVASGVSTQTWVHLHPNETWEHQVVNPGEALRSVCSVWAPYGNGSEWWDLVVDNTSGIAGYTLDQDVSGARPTEC
ncbi:MAG: hypothetical protein HOW97_11995 [Catenulispora sp.]|nr:hypothetical protein [Catenulispora sp.]